MTRRIFDRVRAIDTDTHITEPPDLFSSRLPAKWHAKASEYFARQVHGCYWFEEYAPRHMLDTLPVDNILFETDYPHPVCLYGDVREKIEAGLSDAPPALRRKLLFDNAARLYKVEQPPI